MGATNAVGREQAILRCGQDHAERGNWKIKWRLEKYNGLDAHEIAGAAPDEVVEHEGNLLMYGGVSCLWQTLIGNGTATAGQSLTYFSNANAAIGVGDSSTAAAATQTDLQASTNKLRVAMNSSYPTHTDGVSSGAATITFQSSFGTTQANYAWAEVAIFNSATAGIGRMLNRLVQSFGTKSGGTWSMTVTVTIS
jgi:hypothetical protein